MKSVFLGQGAPFDNGKNDPAVAINAAGGISLVHLDGQTVYHRAGDLRLTPRRGVSRNHYRHPGLYAKGDFPWYPNVAVRSPAGRLYPKDQGARLPDEQSPD